MVRETEMKLKKSPKMASVFLCIFLMQPFHNQTFLCPLSHLI